VPHPAGAAELGDAQPRRRHVWIRALAALLLLLVFWVDTLTPVGIAIPSLYVAPTLLFIAGGRSWEPLLVAAVASGLTAAGLHLSPESDGVEIAKINRPLQVLVIWISALLVAQYRRSQGRWLAQYLEDRRVRDESLRRLEEFRYALDQAAIVAVTDQRGIITYANDRFCEISKYSRNELIGQDHRIINSGFHSKEYIRDLWRTIAQGRVWSGEFRNRAKDGSHYWVDTTIVPFLNQAGKPRQYLAIRHDITQRKRAEQQLADQAALAQLGQLAAVVAHEVRNPLAGVKGTLQIFRSRTPSGSPDRQVIEAMIARLDVLNAKVEDILRFARPRKPVLDAVDARGAVIDAIAQAGAAVGAACPGMVPPQRTATIAADREMLIAILLNLLLNACQAETAAPVEVTIDDENQRCRISVLDRGPGIPDLDLERVFEPFYTTKKGGTGLGLAIVHRLVGLQNGTIVLRPREGGGLRVDLSFPLARRPA
jgi:two-component system CheB/CheR fusion protein